MNRRIRKLFAVVAAAVLVVGLGPTAAAWGGAAGRQHENLADVEARDVTLVFGAGVLPSGQPSNFLRARLDLAADLYKAGKTTVILVTGDHTEQYYNEPEAMRRYLHEKRQVPLERIVADYAGIDTYNSCDRARRIFGVSKVTLVSQSYHLPRAISTCRMVGVDAQGLGDSTMRVQRSAWWGGVAREVPATMKMIFDVMTGRESIGGPPEDGVAVALARR